MRFTLWLYVVFLSGGAAKCGEYCEGHASDWSIKCKTFDKCKTCPQCPPLRPLPETSKLCAWIPSEGETDCDGRLYSELLRHFKEYGYVKFTSCSLKNQHGLLNALTNFTRSHFQGPNAPPVRVQDAWQQDESVRDAAADPDINRLLAYLHDGRCSQPFQTLNFARGTQQHVHSDVVHFDTQPRRGMMTAAWIAMEDIHPDSGPLVYYPGSHRVGLWDYLQLGIPPADPDVEVGILEWTANSSYRRYETTLKNLIETLDLKPSYATDVKRGDAFIWSASLLHGGSPIKDTSRTRLSQVTHYWVDGGLQQSALGNYWSPRKSGGEGGAYLKDPHTWKGLIKWMTRSRSDGSERLLPAAVTRPLASPHLSV